MPYLIEISHPNELCWKIVDIVDDVEDELHSPSFGMFNGLLVRVTNQDGRAYYFGAYYESQWINLGPESYVMKNRFRGHVRDDVDFVQAITKCSNVKDMIYMLKGIIDRKTLFCMVKACVALLILPQHLRNILNKPQYRENDLRYLSQEEERLHNAWDDEDLESFRKLSESSAVETFVRLVINTHQNAIYEVSVNCLHIVISTLSMGYRVQTGDLVDEPRYEAILCETMRANFSLFDVILTLCAQVKSNAILA